MSTKPPKDLVTPGVPACRNCHFSAFLTLGPYWPKSGHWHEVFRIPSRRESSAMTQGYAVAQHSRRVR